jgi:phosphonopyruvate decarboxylase
MKSRKEALHDIFKCHGANALYIFSTGYIARAAYDLFEKEKCIFYMSGSMGLAPGIGIGLALNTTKDVVVVSGDASLLMHLGITHTIRDLKMSNLYVYILDNNCHESVGGHPCAPLEKDYPGIKEIIPISKEGKTPRVGITFEENAKQIKDILGVRE